MNAGQVMDPDWAWRPFTPTSERPWDRRLAAHLYRRAGFGADLATLDEALRRPVAEVVRALVAGAERAAAAVDPVLEQLEQSAVNGGNPESLAAAWTYRMLHGPSQLLEKLTLFWHGHFATSAEKVEDVQLMLSQNRLFRRYAVGDFGQLAQEVSRDPAMLIYLDSATNRRAHPNENYARELMELFCLGEGNYSERDVQELARCFTGWEVRGKAFRFNRYQHDSGSKTILGETGEFGGERAVEIVLQQASCPRFIAGKLIQYLVLDEPRPSAALIEPLADLLREQQLKLAPVLERILGSQLFFSELAVGRKIRSPVELAVGLLRCLQGSTNAYTISSRLRDLGQGLYYPPNVKGWEGGRSWINSSTLLARANLVNDLLRDPKTRFAGGNLESLIATWAPADPRQRVERLSELLLARPLPAELARRLEELAGSGDPRQLVYTLCALPEYQLA